MKAKSRRTASTLLVAPLAIGWAVACATAPPHEAVARAGAAVTAAEKAGAAEDAPLSLRRSRDEVEKAEKAMQEEQYDEARRAAEAAEVDAEHAAAEARRAKATRSHEELAKSVRVLEEEIRHDQR
jgi:hypothetical protein